MREGTLNVFKWFRRNGADPVEEAVEELPKDPTVTQSEEGTRRMREEMGRFHKGIAEASATNTDLAKDMEEYRRAQKASGLPQEQVEMVFPQVKCTPIAAPLLQQALEILRGRPNIAVDEFAGLLKIGRDFAVRVHNKAYEVLHRCVQDEALPS